MKKIFILSAFFLGTILGFNKSFAQQTNNWYFGSPYGTRLDFGSTPPSVQAGLLTTAEGSSAISDANGKPLFYTSGTQMWDATVTPNTVVSSTLLGDPSGTQSAIIMPKPGSTNKWLLFTGNTDVDGINKNGLNYYEVTGASATSGPFTLTAPVNLAGTDAIGEGLAIIGSTNPLYSFWVIVREVNLPGGSNRIRAYPVTTAGAVLSAYVPSSAGGITTVAKQGFIKANTCQNKLAFTYMTPGITEAYDFDATNGVVVTGSLTTLNVSTAYGVEFSPSSNYLYVTELNGKLHQFTIGANGAAWPNYTYTGPTDGFGALQLAPNGLIYTTNITKANALGVITAPNAAPAAGNFSPTGLTIPNGVFRGLPNFPKSLIVNKPVIIPRDSTICKGTSLTFNYLFGGAIGTGPTDFQWDIFDPTQSSTNTIGSRSHTFNNVTAAGSPIKVRLTIRDACGRVSKDSVFITVQDIKDPLGAVTCVGNTVTLDAANASDPDKSKFVWYDAATGGNIIGVGVPVSFTYGTTTAPGTYWVEVAGTVTTTSSGTNAVAGPTTYNYQDNGTPPQHRFNVLADQLTLKSFQIQPNTFNATNCNNISFTLIIRNSGGTILLSQPFTFTTNTCGTSITVPVNISLPKGNGYTITLSGLTGNNPYWSTSTVTTGSIAGAFNNTGPATGTSFITNYTVDYKNFSSVPICSKRNAVSRVCSLPVEFVSFTAERSGNNVELNWVTAKEKNNSHFEVERSFDNENFTLVATVAGAGNSSSFKYYNAKDKASSATVYYRVKQVDYNGDYDYSDVRAVKGSDVAVLDVKVYPNPNNGSFTLEVDTEGSESVRAEIFNILGASVWFENLSSEGKIVREINLGGLSKGVYFLKAAGVTHKIVIN